MSRLSYCGPSAHLGAHVPEVACLCPARATGQDGL